MNLQELLYKVTKTPITVASTLNDSTTVLTTGMQVDDCCCTAVAARKKRKVANGPAKISTIGLIFDRLFGDKNLYLAVVNDNQGYAEFSADDGTVYAGICDGSQVKWLEGRAPESPCIKLAPIFAYVYSMGGELTNALDSAIEFRVETDEGLPVSPHMVARTCDSFYYEYAVDYMKTDYPDSTPLTEEELKQCVRTKNFEPIFKQGKTSDFLSSSYETASTSEGNSEWDEIKKGAKMVGFDWLPEQEAKIPSLASLDKFAPSEDFFSLFKMIEETAENCLMAMDSGKNGVDAIKEGGYVNSILVGKPGTGKTTIAYALGAALGLPVYTVVNSRNTEEDNFEGKSKVVSGQIQYVPTPFIEAYKNGGIVVLEEFNLISPDVIMGALGQAVESPFILMEDGYTEVRRHPLCFILATMNTCTQGSKEPNEAFTSRFPDVFLLDDPAESDFIKILQCGGYEEADCRKVYTAYTSILDYLKSIDELNVAMSITLRHCLAALKAMRGGLNFKAAIKRTMVNPIGIKDLELSTTVYQTVVEPMKK